MMITNKSKAKKYDGIRAQAIKWTAVKFDVSREYVRAAIYGTSAGGRTDEILKAFNEKYRELQKILS